MLTAICDTNAEKAAAFAQTWGYERIETDWRKLMEADDIDLIDICVPNFAHHEIAIAAAKAGKIVICEKPLAMNVAEAEEMVNAVEAAGVPNLVMFNYRRVPAITLARQLIDKGKIGRPFHFRAIFLQDWTISADVPQGGDALWRLDVKAAGSGVTGDLLAHNIDTAMWLNGAITSVVARTETFVKERMHTLTGKVEPVGIDDACMFIAEFANGSIGMFESTRYARGHKALKTFELNGADGSVAFNLEEMEYLDYFQYAGSDSDTSRLAADSRHQRRAPLHGQVLGARTGHRLRTFVPQHASRLCVRPRKRHGRAADLPHRPANSEGLRRHSAIRQDRSVDRNRSGAMKSTISRRSALAAASAPLIVKPATAFGSRPIRLSPSVSLAPAAAASTSASS